MNRKNKQSIRETDTPLDPARTGRNLHRQIHESMFGNLLEHMELYAARSFMHACRALPGALRPGLEQFLANLAFELLSRQRKICYGNLTLAAGTVWDPKRIRSFTQDIFSYWSKAFVDFGRLRLQMTRSNWTRYIAVTNLHSIDRALERHNGVILVGPHMGNWEFIAQALVLSGYSVTSVARRRKKSSLLDQDLLAWRTKWGQRILYRDESPRQILRRLGNGEIIGIVSDQYAGRDGVFTNFFGTPASHHDGPAVLADRAEVPLIPCHCHWDGELQKYRVVIEDPLEIDRNQPREERVEQLVNILFDEFERMIRAHPRQWLWFHRKWREKWLPEEKRQLLKSAPYL